MIDLVTLGATAQDDATGAVLYQATRESADGGVEPYGELAAFGWLGLTSSPAAPTDAGQAEAVVVRRVGSWDIVVAARDTRTAGIAGELSPGDTVLHTTGPNNGAFVHLSDELRTVTVVARGADAKPTTVQLTGADAAGKGARVAVSVGGSRLDVTDEGVFIAAPGGTVGISVTNDGIHLRGPSTKVGGVGPVIQYLMTSVTPLSPGGPAAAPMSAAPGLTIHS